MPKTNNKTRCFINVSSTLLEQSGAAIHHIITYKSITGLWDCLEYSWAHLVQILNFQKKTNTWLL